jgi:hypothetical protein
MRKPHPSGDLGKEESTSQKNNMPSESNGTESHSDSDKAVHFQGQQPYGMPSDLVVAKILNIDDTDERLWVCHRSPVTPAL